MVYIVGLVVFGYYFSFIFYVYVMIMIIYKILCGFRGGLILINDEVIVKKINFVVFLGF